MFSKTKRQKQAEIREYKRQLKQLEKYNLYSPKSDEITPRKIATIKSIYNKNKKYFDRSEYVFVKFPKYTETRLRAKTKKLDFATSKSGVFIPIEGQRKAEIEFNRQYQEYQIKITGQTKYGKTKGRRITSYVPLSTRDAKNDELKRLKQEFNSLNLKKNEYARIRVVETGNDGFSNKIFKDFEFLERYLEGYKKSLSDRIQFYRYIKIEKITEFDHSNDVSAKYKKPKKLKVNKQGRNV